MVGLGVGIDYALFLVTRHREYLARGMTVEESVGRAVATAGQSVVFAGGTVVIAILGLAVAGVPFMTAAGVAISVIVLIMVVASVTLLPAFLGLAGHRINGFGRRRNRRRRTAAEGLGWRRWGGHVSRHAAAYAVGATVVLMALAAPVLALQIGTPDEGCAPAAPHRASRLRPRRRRLRSRHQRTAGRRRRHLEGSQRRRTPGQRDPVRPGSRLRRTARGRR